MPTTSKITTHSVNAGGLEPLLDELPIGILTFDDTGTITYRNALAQRILAEEVNVVAVLQAGDDMIPPQDWASAVSDVLSGDACRYDYVTYALKSSIRRLVNISLAPIFDNASSGESTIIGGALAIEDTGALGEHTQADQRTKMSGASGSRSDGTLTARVAHELNNPLDGLSRYLGLALRLLDRGGEDNHALSDVPNASLELKRYLQEAANGAARMALIVRELLGHARASAGQSEPTPVNRIVEEAVRTVEDAAAERGVTIAATYRDEGMPLVRGTALFQVCRNLAQNAVDAMPSGGVLTVQTGIVEQWVILRFEDQGTGLPDDVESIFEPFYSTKPPDVGTGLGLAICRDHVRRLGGTLTAGSSVHGGAVFTVRFPVGAFEQRDVSAGDTD